MTDAFVFAANAVLPIVLMIALGYMLKRIGLFSQGFLDVGNKLTFRVLIPSLLYFNIYSIGSLGDINFGFVLYGIEFLYKTLENLKSICTPFALLVLGGKFEFSAVKRQLRYIVFGTLIRTIAVPVIGLSVAYFFIPGLLGEHYATYVAVFATPVAVASAIMAKEMKADDELAGQLVVWTSLISTVTIFIYVVFFRSVGIF